MVEARERLDNLLFVTDAQLRRLDLHDLLAELLDRIREILLADTAAVLLYDAASNSLVATAARGLEEEVHQAIRIPVGRGFAGRIAASRRPVVINRVDETTVRNPILWEKGICTMLGVPLLGDAETLVGVVHIGRLEPTSFSEEDVSLMEIAAERLAGAIQSSQLVAERSAATILERSLMPAVLPELRDARLSARYAAAEQGVGGDWYDAFVLPSGTLWMVAGDVAGHGMRAAVVMGRVKSSLRAYALLGESPERTLTLTDMKVSHFEMDRMVTVSCAVAHPPYAEFRISSAGHPPPLLVPFDGKPAYVEVAQDLPLGIDGSRERHGTSVTLRSGDILFMYTDGLVERPWESIDFGLDRLRDVETAADPDAYCSSVMHRLVGSIVPQDDIAILAVQHLLPSTMTGHRSQLFAADPGSVSLARNFAIKRLRGKSYDLDAVALVVTELAANAVMHAGTPYIVEVCHSSSRVRVEVTDWDEAVPTALVPPASQPHGRGLLLVDQLSLSWGVSTRSGGKTVWAELS